MKMTTEQRNNAIYTARQIRWMHKNFDLTNKQLGILFNRGNSCISKIINNVVFPDSDMILK